MAVKLSESSTADTPKVERATNDQLDRAIGVATTTDESTVTVASGAQSVYIETTGEVDAYISNVNGEVNKGDLLTISPLSGILGKYNDGDGSVFALALEDFNSDGGEEYSISTQDGEQSTRVGKIRVNLDQKGLVGKEKDTSLEKLGHTIVGKQVSELRVAVAVLIFIIVLVAEGAILYGAISSAVSSMGRNPLASDFIRKELIKVVGIAFVVLLFGLGSIYLILWI